MKTTKAERKFELYSRLASLGFTFEESARLRRIEMTLQRWAEAECNGEIERNEETGRPFRRHDACGSDGRTWVTKRYPIADRKAGALTRLEEIVKARNVREFCDGKRSNSKRTVIAYHKGDPRGCALYLLTRAQLLNSDGKPCDIDSCYSSGLAVCT